MREADLEPTGAEEAMVRHLEWVLEINQHINLTAIESFDAGLRLHVLDSLTCLPELAASKTGPMLDVGTGGGFPGVPLGLATGRETVLLDSVGKKVHALDGFLKQNGLSHISTHPGRAEEYARERPGGFAVVVCRAVAPLASLLELASPLLGDGGSFIALKGRLEPAEYEHALSVAALVGLKPMSRRFLSLPRCGEHREIVRFVREGNPSVALPRRTGMAQKRPLSR